MNYNKDFNVSGNIIDVVGKNIFQGTIYIKVGKIFEIIKEPSDNNHYILPGLIDAHIHIESSMVIPSEFARAAVVHGTIATVSDPHEIANIMGMEGIKFMINNGKKVNFKFYFGAPSCVPATDFETSGAVLGLKETEELLKMKEIKYLSEMMNFPAVLYNDSLVYGKLELARKYNKVIDGHAPGLRNTDAEKYIKSGITTDHECFSIDEAKEKIKLGMKILIREGSAAKNFDELIPLIKEYPGKIMFCSDDRHPDDLVNEHINSLVKRAIRKGYDLFDILRCCTLNPVKHYDLDAGLLQTGDSADFIIADDLQNFNIIATYINGDKVAENGITLIESVIEQPINNFNANHITEKDIEIMAESDSINVIEAIDGQLITNLITAKAKIENNRVISDSENDIIKIVVLNRYKPSKPAVGFIKSFNIKQGAIASSIAHDSHNIIAVGADDKSIIKLINMLIDSKGGIAFTDNPDLKLLPMPVGGIMSNADIYSVSEIYKNISVDVKKTGTTLTSPYMTLSFMSLLVIPFLKIGDKGLFDSNKFTFKALFNKF